MLVEDLFEFLAAKLFRSNMPLNWKKKSYSRNDYSTLVLGCVVVP